MAEFFAQYLWFIFDHLPSWALYAFTGLVQCVMLLHVPLVGAMFFVWVERKAAARIQDRLGPTRVGGLFGWLQLLADGIKLLTKEDLRPKEADALLFRLAPYVGFCASFVVLIALPFSDTWAVQWLDVGVFFILAVLGLEIFGVILAGWASASKWSLFGAMREAAQVVSYEVPLGICVVVPVMIAGTMDLVAIGQMQEGLFLNWLIFHDPFIFVIFWVYFTCAVASVNRAPFDLAEAESELVAGFHTEYSGFRWLIFYMAEYGSMFIVSGLAAILFFGAWNGPIPVTKLLGLTDDNGALLGYLGRLLGLLNFMFKSILGVTVMIWLRWTVPRLRIDQVMTMCLKYCTPIAAAMFLGAAAWTYTFPGGVTGLRGVPYGNVRGVTAQTVVLDPVAVDPVEAAPVEADPAEADAAAVEAEGAEVGEEPAETPDAETPAANDADSQQDDSPSEPDTTQQTTRAVAPSPLTLSLATAASNVARSR